MATSIKPSEPVVYTVVRSKKYSIGNIVSKTAIYLVLGFWSLVVVFPMLWSVLTSLKTDQEIFFSPWAMPKILMFENFARAWVKARMGEYLINTLLIIIPALFFTLLLSSMAAYVLARYEFRGRTFLTYLFMLGMIFPIFLALVPLYFVMRTLGLLDTFPGMILVYIAFS
jgi:N-acetylglucosamine transport system permease protein